MSAPEMATSRLPKRRADDFLLPSPKRSPLVEPGRYVGVTTAVKRHSYKGIRDYLLLSFDLFANHDGMVNGEVVAQGVPHFMSLDSVGPRSKYSRLLSIFFPDRPQAERLAASDLLGKVAEVEVETVVLDASQEALLEELRYSRVSEVLRRA
jgi:hypothetical protein